MARGNLLELLAARGANLSRLRADGYSPYALAAIDGNVAVAEWLALPGARDTLEPVDRWIATASRGDHIAVDALLAGHAAWRSQTRPDHYAALYCAVTGGLMDTVRLLARGAATNVRDREFRHQSLVWATEGSRMVEGQAGDNTPLADCCWTLAGPWAGAPRRNCPTRCWRLSKRGSGSVDK